MSQKHSVLPKGVINLEHAVPLGIVPFYEPKEFMTYPRSRHLVGELGLEPGSLDS
jgi:hypothetical protein